MSSSSSISSSPPVTLICSVCGEKSSLRCSKCLGAFYCSVPCQKKDWKVHRVICKKAQEVKKGYEALGCHTVEEIDAKLEENIKLAELGNAGAQYNMGLSYFNGVGVGVDKVEGIKWFRLAANQGDAQAQYNLGQAYSHGDGVSIDKVEAVKWFRLAANQGLAQAQTLLVHILKVKVSLLIKLKESNGID
jgi:hypothetical protein